jgi:hypothetical protein
MADAPIDLQQVRREIEAEVRARRASGAYPAGFEREMDALFARFAPPEVTEDFDAALERAEEDVAVDPVIPTASRNPAFGLVKRIVARLLGWYHVWLAQRLTGFGAVLTNALRLLGNRVDELERSTHELARARDASRAILPVRDDAVWAPLVIESLRDCDGRVVILEMGDGTLLDELLRQELDAYGVEPRAVIADKAVERALEVRVDDGRTHLRHVESAALAGVVLRGIVEGTPVGELLGIVDLVTERLRDGGVLVVCSLHPDSWGEEATAVEADLATGRPLQPQTWETLLPEQGFTRVTATPAGAGAYVVTAVRRNR